MRKIGRTIMRLITKGFMGMTLAVFMLSACALDSECWKSALAMCGVSFAILSMYAIANGAMEW